MIGEITWHDGKYDAVDSQSVSFEGASPEFRTRQRMLDWFTSVIDSRDDTYNAFVAGNVMDDYGFRGWLQDDQGTLVGEFSIVWENMK